MKFASSISVVLSVLTTNTNAGWNYEDRGNNYTHWPGLYPECGFRRQSPIDVPVDLTTTCLEPLELDWTSEHSPYVIRNTGHSLQAIPFVMDSAGGSDVSGLEILHHRNDTNIRLTNSFYGTYSSKVNKEYCFDSLHFHWGRTNDEGSEHTINGKAYPLEVHLVHYSCDYYLAGDALRDYAIGEAEVRYDDDNVLAVVGVMFEIGAPNPVLQAMLEDTIIDGIYQNEVESNNNLLQLYYTEFDLRGLLPDSREMVAYLGSLTTPPCYETVRWHVMKEAMTVSQEQMDKFRQMLEGTDLNETQAPNFRPPLPLNGRKVWQCQEDVDGDMIADDVQLFNEGVFGESDGGDEWKIIGIVFVSLFVVTCVVGCISVLICSKKWKVGLSVERKHTRSVRDYEDDVHEQMQNAQN